MVFLVKAVIRNVQEDAFREFKAVDLGKGTENGSTRIDELAFTD